MNNKRVLLLLLVGLAAAFCVSDYAGAQGASQTKITRVISMLDRTHNFAEVDISPDGTHVAFVEYTDAIGNMSIYVRALNAATGTPQFVTAANGGVHAEHDVVWSPDGKRIAFLSDAAQRGQLQLCIADVPEGETKCVTHVKGDLSSPQWSPDGMKIAVLFVEDAPRASGPLAAETPDEGVVEEHPFEQKLAIVDLATGNVKQITPANMYIYEFDWSRDGKHFAVTAAEGSGDDNWYIAELFSVDAGKGAMKSIYKPPVEIQMAQPRWSPDGKSVAFIGGLMSDEGATGGDIYVANAEGGAARNVTPRIGSSPSRIAWLPDGRRILFAGHDGGGMNFGAVDVTTNKVESLWRGDETLGGAQFSLAGDGKTTAVIRHSYTTPPEVWIGEVGAWKKVTDFNSEMKSAWGKTECLAWTSDNFQVQGWLMYPAEYDPAKKYPMVVNVHGGPAAVVTPHWPSSGEFATFLSPEGYFVLFPNPRGSYGRGEEFTRANVKDYGYGDFRDIMAGVDAALKHAQIDPSRIGLTGWSYGGYMTMWGVTQTNRFRAAVAGAGIANWQSYYGENKIDKWMIPYFGASVYDDPAVYAKSSPITFIKNTKTPTLILVGDSDGECPPPQSYEFWHALKTLNVETQFVIYPHEGHHFNDGEHLRDRIERVAEWFNRHLK
jgi:dipeptidyl aminopeptidase/acylaminoacyl peptidase